MDDDLHPLVDQLILHRLQLAIARQGTRIIERIPSPSEISAFFNELQTHTDDPLYQRLYYNGEDGTVFVRHVSTRNNLSTSPYHIDLCTVAHDYTRVSRTPFRQDDTTWPTSYTGGSTDVVAVTIVPLLDELQRYLLTRSPAFFHSASLTEQDESGGNVTYTLRTAYRVATHNEPVTDLKTLSWRPFGWSTKATRQCTRSEATLWAISHIIPTDSRADILRLRHIHATVRGIFNMENNIFNSNFKKISRRSIPSGNSLTLVASRLSTRHDSYGRVRYPMLRSCICDQTLLGLMEEQNENEQTRHWSFVVGQEEHKRTLPLVTSLAPTSYYDSSSRKRKGKRERGLESSSIVRIGCNIIFLLAFVAIAVYYTLNHTNASRSALVQWILWGLVIVTFVELVFMCISFIISSQSSESKTLKALIRQATVHDNLRYQIDLASTMAAKYTFDGKWLSFNGIEYEGAEEYQGRKFNISDLMKAGYETTFCMDGREALVLPGSSHAVRLDRLDESGSAVFTRCESESSQMPTGIVDGVRGTWASDVAVSREAVHDTRRDLPSHMV